MVTTERLVPHLFLCTGSSIVNTANTYGWDQITLAAGQACLLLSAQVRVTSNGSALTISSKMNSGSNKEIYATTLIQTARAFSFLVAVLT